MAVVAFFSLARCFVWVKDKTRGGIVSDFRTLDDGRLIVEGGGGRGGGALIVEVACRGYLERRRGDKEGGARTVEVGCDGAQIVSFVLPRRDTVFLLV